MNKQNAVSSHFFWGHSVYMMTQNKIETTITEASAYCKCGRNFMTETASTLFARRKEYMPGSAGRLQV